MSSWRTTHVELAIRALEAHGYSRSAQNVGQLVSHQIALARLDTHGVWHAIDVHWKVANPHVFANLVTVEELMAESVALPALGPHARTLSAPHALVIATVHLAAHHTHQLRLIWLYDLHVLCGRLTLPEFAAVVELVRSRGLATVCATGLHAAGDGSILGYRMRSLLPLMPSTRRLKNPRSIWLVQPANWRR